MTECYAAGLVEVARAFFWGALEEMSNPADLVRRGRGPTRTEGEKTMRLRVACFSVSVDGFGAGPRQDREHPLGVGGEAVHQWAFATRTFHTMHGGGGGATGVDDDFAARGFAGVGAWILGRNMFGPVRGPWPDDSWRGWWGETPPYHTPVFVLTHHARAPLAMNGGTTFHFVTGGIRQALDRAREAAGPKDVRLGGGVATIRQYVEAGLVDEMHLAIAPALLGTGESLLAGIDLVRLGYRVTERVTTPATMHVVLTKGT
jgi:dihydrofolate reductase